MLVAAAAVIALTLGFVGANVAGLRDRLIGDPAAPAVIKLAVLPFANLTGDKGQEYFSDGLTDELITHIIPLRRVEAAAARTPR